MPHEVEKQPSKLELDEYCVVWNEDKLELYVRCGRCGKLDKIDRFKQHQDGVLSFTYYCMICHWMYSIYRGRLADNKEVNNALSKGKHYPSSKIKLRLQHNRSVK